MIKYNHFREYVNCIPKEYCKDWKGNTVLQRDWNKYDSEYFKIYKNYSKYIKNVSNNPAIWKSIWTMIMCHFHELILLVVLI